MLITSAVIGHLIQDVLMLLPVCSVEGAKYQLRKDRVTIDKTLFPQKINIIKHGQNLKIMYLVLEFISLVDLQLLVRKSVF